MLVRSTIGRVPSHVLLSLATCLAACSEQKDREADLDAGPSRDAADDNPDAVGSLCFASAYRCEGNVALPCEPGAERVDCTPLGLFCNPLHGCSECVPGQTSCADGKATWCRDDGTLAEFECDSMQGLTCEPGGCRGPCALNEVQDSYIGCDYYPTVTLNPVWQG